MERNFPEAKAVSRGDKITIGKVLIEIAAKYGMTVRPCAEGNNLAAYGVDIGAYDTCGHLCKYCYANEDVNLVKENRKKHNPKSPFLIGESMLGDVIHEAEQKSWLDRQLRFDIFY